MNVFISVDMEGVAGIAHGDQVTRGTNDFGTARLLMTMEANAAVEGAFEGGATRVLVNDSHADMHNLLAEEMDDRAEVLIGSPKLPHSMVQGIAGSFDVALFIGYHAPPGTPNAVLDHTYSGLSFYDVRINGESVSEAELNAAMAGAHGVPVGLVTGDTATCATVRERLPDVKTVAVKESFGRQSAASVHPSKARAAIRSAAESVVKGSAALRPFTIEGPVTMEVDTRDTLGAEACALAPGTERVRPRTVRHTASTFPDAFRYLLAWMYLAKAVAR